ncbi:glycosyltransferase family 4 protein [Mycolicibacterium sphagni]|uniref:glycosyltransferase family 4 protein n=1 Tax=Mycolicibacterium sphagni TaxID=1786 RepID=UPI001F1A8A57|nr:glycosyltransferase family 4 protein [Mycolicibacterium sphagni]
MVASSLRIAMMIELYHPSVGGQEVFFQELGETLVQRGHSVDVYCIGHTGGLAGTETINGVTIHRNPNGGRYKQPLVKALRRNWTDIVKFSAGVRRIASAHQHDFYLLNQWPLMHALALPKDVRARSAIHWCEIRTDPILTACQTRLPRIVGSNFAVSEAVAVVITEQSGRPCGVLPSGITLSRYRNRPRDDRSGVLYLGRIAPHKNLPLLIDAFELAAAKGLTGDLMIAGDGPSRADVEAYAQRSPLASRVRVLGSVTEAQKLELLSQAAVFGMPSTREGFPRVITESMASGLPVVTPDFPGNGSKEVVAQYKAGIVCGTTPTDFAEALLATEADWNAFSQAGVAAAQTLDWSHIAETLEARIQEVLGK